MAQIQNLPIVLYITENITNQLFLCFSNSESPYLELFILVVLFHAFNLNVALDTAFFWLIFHLSMGKSTWKG